MTNTMTDDRKEPLRLNAYYYSFEPTGCFEIDLILSAVARAGKAYHHTDSWGEETAPYDARFRGACPIDWIQNAAIDAARALSAQPSPDAAQGEPCGCKEFCEHHNRDEIATDADGNEFCNECAADGGSGELCTPSPQSCFPGDDKANEWERSFMCPKHAAEHVKFCAESDAEDAAQGGEHADIRQRAEDLFERMSLVADDSACVDMIVKELAQGGECGEVPQSLAAAAAIETFERVYRGEPQQAQGDDLAELLFDLESLRNNVDWEGDNNVLDRALTMLKRLVPADQSGSAASAGKPATSGMWLLRVKPKYQQGRGEYERAEHRGYTDNILHAGRFTEEWAKKCAAECPEKIEAIPDPYGPARQAANAVSSVQDEAARAVASIETPPEVKGRVMSEMFWKGVYALQSALSRNKGIARNTL